MENLDSELRLNQIFHEDYRVKCIEQLLYYSTRYNYR